MRQTRTKVTQVQTRLGGKGDPGVIVQEADILLY